MIRLIEFYHPFFILLSHSAFHIVKSLVLKTLAAFFYQSTFATDKFEHRYAATHRSLAYAPASAGMTCVASLDWVLF